MKKILENIILFLIYIVEKVEYRNNKFREDDFDKIINTINVDNIKIETDYGWVPMEEISITKPYDIWTLELINGDILKCADNHLVFIQDHMIQTVKDLKLTDKVLCKEDPINGIAIKSIKKSWIKSSMFDVSIGSDEKSFYTNNILSHNTISTSIFILHYTMFNDDKNIMIVANKGKTTAEIILKIKDIYKLLPFFLQQGVNNWNQKQVTFENNCKIRTEARSSEPAIGTSIDVLYLDEFAHIPKNIIVPYYTAVVPTVVSIKNSKIIITSTPKGFNLFYELLRDAERQPGDPLKNRFKAMRVYWWELEGRRDTKLYVNLNNFEKYGRKNENIALNNVLEVLKTDYKLNWYDGYEDSEKVYFLKHYKDDETTYLDFIKTIRIDDIPLTEFFLVTNWEEEQTKLIGGTEAFKQEYDLQFITGSKLLFDNLTIENITSNECDFDYQAIDIFEKRFHLNYTDLQFIKNRPDIFDISKAKSYNIIASVDLAEGLGKDYTVINLFKVKLKDSETIEKNKEKYSTIYDLFTLEQIGLFRCCNYSLNEVAHIFYLLIFEIFDPDKCKVVLEYNTYGGQFLTHLPQVFNENNNYSNSVFFRYKHSQDQKISKPGIKINSNKKLLIKEFRDNILKGNIIIRNRLNMNEISLFTKKELSNGDFTYQAETGNDDIIMTCVTLSSIFNHVSYKDFIDEIVGRESNGDLINLLKKKSETNDNDTTIDFSSFTSGYKNIYKNGGGQQFKPNGFGKDNRFGGGPNPFIKKPWG